MDCLCSLIGESSVNFFLSDVYEQRMAHYAGVLKGAMGFSLDEFETILGMPGLRPYLRLVANQVEDYDPKIVANDGHLCKPYALSRFHEGASIVVNEVHRFSSRLMDLASSLSEELGVQCVVNAYLTPPQSVALSPHFDSHDIFALQVVGQKQWFVDSEHSSLTTKSTFQPILSADQASSVDFREVVMDEGDVMYLPRGCVHHARTISCQSMHLTVGLYPLEWSEFIASAVEIAASAPEARGLRTSVPLGLKRQHPSFYRQELLDRLSGLFTDEVIEKALRSREKEFSAGQPSSFAGGLDADSWPAGSIASDDAFERCAEAVYFYPAVSGVRVVSSGYGFTLKHPNPDRVLKVLSHKKFFTLGELTGGDECSLNDIACIQALLRRGILRRYRNAI